MRRGAARRVFRLPFFRALLRGCGVRGTRRSRASRTRRPPSGEAIRASTGSSSASARSCSSRSRRRSSSSSSASAAGAGRRRAPRGHRSTATRGSRSSGRSSPRSSSWRSRSSPSPGSPRSQAKARRRGHLTVRRRGAPVLLAVRVSERRRSRSTTLYCRSTAPSSSSSPACDVIHSWWVPALTGKMDAIAGRINSCASWRGDRRLRRASAPSSAAIQHAVMPTTRQGRRTGRVRVRGSQRAGRHLRRRPRAAASGRPSAPSATAWTERETSGPGIAGNGTLTNRAGPRSSSSARARTRDSSTSYMPPVGLGWTGQAVRRPHRVHRRRRPKPAGHGSGSGEWRLGPRPSRRPGRKAASLSWVTTVDHKRIGVLYIVTAFGFFLAAGVMALLMRVQLSQADNDFLTRTATTSSSRSTGRR